jgi:arylsulfatase A-like enzyme
VLVPPRHAVAHHLFDTSGAVIAPLLAQVRDGTGEVASPEQERRPDVPATSPALLPGDSIVILFVIDALRADVVAEGKYGPLLPNIEMLREESVEFSLARAPASGTIWSLASIFSSRYYSQLYWTPKPGGSPKKAYPHEDQGVRFPEILQRAGVDTCLCTEMPDVKNGFGVVRGFAEERLARHRSKHAGPAIVSAIVRKLRAPRTQPLFLYLQLLEAHAPYKAGGEGDTPFERYIKQVSEIDAMLGTVREAIDEIGATDRTTIVLTADHGEAFGEHRTHYHAVSVYEELLRVPLLVHVPGVRPHRVDAPVTLMDLGPTVLDLFGQTTPGSYMGQSLVPFLRGDSPVLTRLIAAETGRRQRALIFPDGFKTIEDLRRHTVEAYDLANDPDEAVNLIDDPDGKADARVREMQVFFQRNAFRRIGYQPPYRP